MFAPPALRKGCCLACRGRHRDQRRSQQSWWETKGGGSWVAGDKVLLRSSQRTCFWLVTFSLLWTSNPIRSKRGWVFALHMSVISQLTVLELWIMKETSWGKYYCINTRVSFWPLVLMIKRCRWQRLFFLFILSGRSISHWGSWSSDLVWTFPESRWHNIGHPKW